MVKFLSNLLKAKECGSRARGAYHGLRGGGAAVHRARAGADGEATALDLRSDADRSWIEPACTRRAAGAAIVLRDSS